MTFYLDTNELTLQTTAKGIRLTASTNDNQLIAGATAEEIRKVVSANYKIVKEHYLKKTENQISPIDLEKVSLKIVLHYFYMYQLWRTVYEKEKNRDLAFIQADFDHPYTADQITAYFKSIYPKNYADKCGIMLGMSSDKFKEYEKNRQAFFDRR